ncbi:unnamed protein product [Linum tenue]|uniref:Uncharacterized protein n=1 Tax=Linum tenue TaxID=586396 RepID=A0AAV0GMS3_9ROSI|nr:unnamed protein product [Linum tenue]
MTGSALKISTGCSSRDCSGGSCRLPC